MKKYVLVLLFGMMVMLQSAKAQIPNYSVVFDRSSEISGAFTFCATRDGGTLFVGQAKHFPNDTVYFTLVKLDSAANIQWEHRLYPDGGLFHDIVQAADGGYFFCYVDSSSYMQYTIMKFDSLGNVQFENLYNLSGSLSFIGVPRIMAKNNGGLYVANGIEDLSTSTGYWNLVSLSPAGVVEWSKGFNASTFSLMYHDLDTCSNGDIILVSSIYYSPSHYSCPALTRVSSSGNMLWSKYYYTPNRGEATANCVTRIVNDEILLAGFVYDTTQLRRESLLLKTDGQGNVLWANSYSDTAFPSEPMKLYRVEDNNVLMIGHFSNHVLPSVSGGNFIKLDSSGNVLNGKRYYHGGILEHFDTLRDGRYAFGGRTLTHVTAGIDGAFTIFTTDKNGSGCDDTALTVFYQPVNVTVVPLTNEVSLPFSQGVTHVPDIIVPYTRWEWCNTVGIDENISASPAVTVFPVPVSAILSVSASESMELVQIFNVHGELCKEVTCNSTDVELNVNGLIDGMYFVCIQTENANTTQKIIVKH